MRIRIVFYRPSWQKNEFQPSVEQSAESWRVSFEAAVVEPEKYEKMIDTVMDRDGDDEVMINRVYQMTQNDFFSAGWRRAINPTSEPCRSSMIGDLFALDDQWYVVDRVGFRALGELASAETIR